MQPIGIHSRSKMAARNALLKYLRVNVKPVLPLQNPRAGVGGLSQLIRRHFSDEAKGSFLDKSEVTDRVLCVVKNFQKVDPSKVEQVIKEQNMLDVFVLVEGYCHLLLERVNLIEQEKNCPEELHEAVSSLIYAASRCGEFPELQEIRANLTTRFGREFAARAVELRNNCGLNSKVIQKLSTRMPSYENKMKMLKEIASDNNIDLPIEDTVSDTTMNTRSRSGRTLSERLNVPKVGIIWCGGVDG